MKYLFLHQNFPGQFRHIAERLASRPGNEVIALRQNRHPVDVKGVGIVSYRFVHAPVDAQIPLLREMESKLLRAEAVADAARRLRQRGWNPDVIIAHPGWGEALLIKDVWPDAALISYVEYFYAAQGQDYNFDPEFASADDDAGLARLRLKNTVMLHALHESDALWTSSQWQKQLFPDWIRERIRVIHDGVDTEYFQPDARASLRIGGKQVSLTRNDEVITYASRSLEPARGFHVLMRALPEILRARPNAQVLIVGKDESSYGPEPTTHRSWLEKMLAETHRGIDPARVHFVGFLPTGAYRSVLQLSRVHLHLSVPFVPSWSPLQAMACGAPTLLSMTASLDEMSVPALESYRYAFTEPQALAAQTIRFLEAPEATRDAIAAECVRFVRQHYQAPYNLDTLDAFVSGARGH